MTGRLSVILLVVLFSCLPVSDSVAAAIPPMRPYTGIGLIVFSSHGDGVDDGGLQLPLYDEPGLDRIGLLTSSRLPAHEWLFDLQEEAPPLIVSARKGDWLRVFYDDAGREAWLKPQTTGRFIPWEQFLRRQSGCLLPGLQPRYLRLLQQPDGKLLAAMTPKRFFKVLKVEDSWALVLREDWQTGWLRWRDDDGRLLIGIGK